MILSFSESFCIFATRRILQSAIGDFTVSFFRLLSHTNVNSAKYINTNIQHGSENGINVECHNPYTISLVHWIRSMHTMMKLCWDLLAVSVKWSLFTKYRFICMYKMCMLCVCASKHAYWFYTHSRFKILRNMKIKFAIYLPGIRTVELYEHSIHSASVIINDTQYTCWQNIDAWPISLVKIHLYITVAILSNEKGDNGQCSIFNLQLIFSIQFQYSFICSCL